jgi:hypothetical protein
MFTVVAFASFSDNLLGQIERLCKKCTLPRSIFLYPNASEKFCRVSSFEIMIFNHARKSINDWICVLSSSSTSPVCKKISEKFIKSKSNQIKTQWCRRGSLISPWQKDCWCMIKKNHKNLKIEWLNICTCSSISFIHPSYLHGWKKKVFELNFRS